ncbi:cysteine synthase A [soil metagenome]
MLNPTYSILSAIGNTPLVQLRKVVPANCADIFIKLEYFNPTGSYKDRMALTIVEAAEKRGVLKPGGSVIECTGGSTGTSLSFICSMKGYHFKAISSDAFAKEKLKAIQMFGGEVELIKSDGGKITPDLIPKMMARAEALANETGAYWTQQFTNTDALEGYRTMGKEIVSQLNKSIDIFCAAVGTAGMVMGVSQTLKVANGKTKIVLLEPASAPLLSTGVKGSHKVEGVGVGFVPPLLDKAYYDEVMNIEEESARIMAKRLVAEEGIYAGTSSALNVVAAIELGKKIGPGHTVVTIACDSGMKYLAGGLFD